MAHQTFPKIVILSGAGISQESGIATFRDADGLWEGHDVMEVASPQGWKANPALVLDFYNQRRQQLLTVVPNDAHRLCRQLEEQYEVQIITQNVDDLHERAGSSKVLHLHGELLSARSSITDNYQQRCESDIQLGDLAADGSQLRPDIVWFGEAVPMLDRAAAICSQADHLIIVGTSLQVYPAASLHHYAPRGCQLYYVDPRPERSRVQPHIEIIEAKASIGMKILCDRLMT